MFRKAYRLPFQLLGVPIYIDVTFLVVLPLFAWIIGSQVGVWASVFGLPDHPSLHGGWTPYLLGLTAAIGLFVSILVHELGHSMTARVYGVQTRRITLWLLGGMAQFDEMPKQRGAEAVVAILGPVVSVAVGALCWLVARALPTSAVPALFVFKYLALTNISLALFNLLPALPLDGGRILRSLLALRMPHLRATQIAGGVSKFLAIAMGLYGFFGGGGIMLVMVAFFVYMAVNAEVRDSLVADMLAGVRVGDLMHRDVRTVPAELTLDDLARTMVREHAQGFVVVDPATSRVVGMVSLEDLHSGAAAPGAPPLSPDTPVGQIMRPVCSVREEAPALDALQRMSSNQCSRLAVVDAAGGMAGVVTRTDLVRAIEMRTMSLNWGAPASDGDGQPGPAWTPPPPLPGDGQRRTSPLHV